MNTNNAYDRLIKGELLSVFIRWYFASRPAEIIHGYISYARAFNELFSFAFLLKTLLSPWKSIRDEYPSKGFNLEGILETFFLNITARGIGLVIRVIAMFVGLLVQAALIAGFGLYLALWMAFPLLAPVLIIALLFYP
jgi:hypothetical protein